MPLVNGQKTKHSMKCVDAYKHLGSKMVASSAIHPEIKARLASMGSIIKPLTTRVLTRRAMPMQTRAAYAHAYMFSRSLHNSAAWPDLTVIEHRSFHSGVMRVLRKVHDGSGARKSDMNILSSLQVLSPMNMIRYHRLLFAAK
eukprot:11934296-Karenia_brevis.AAC.1